MKDTKSGIICLTKIRESVDKCYEEYRTSIEIAKVQIVSIEFTFCALLKRPKALVSDSVTDSSRCLRNVLRPKSDFGSINSMLLRSLRSETSDAIRKLRRLKTQPEIYILALAFRVSN